GSDALWARDSALVYVHNVCEHACIDGRASRLWQMCRGGAAIFRERSEHSSGVIVVMDLAECSRATRVARNIAVSRNELAAVVAIPTGVVRQQRIPDDHQATAEACLLYDPAEAGDAGIRRNG